MALAIATNNAALNAAASASSVNRDMETSMARLSTGKRINSASDDAAGVAISSRLSAEIRGTDQAIRNSLDGQALIDTAEGAHKEVENILQRMREVAVQAANDTNNDQDRANLQAEMNAMTTEIDRIAGTTTWAGANLMEAATSSFSFQVGTATGSKNQITVNIDSMNTAGLGLATAASASFTVTAAATASGVVSGDLGAISETAGSDDWTLTAGTLTTVDSGTISISHPTTGEVLTAVLDHDDPAASAANVRAAFASIGVSAEVSTTADSIQLSFTEVTAVSANTSNLSVQETTNASGDADVNARAGIVKIDAAIKTVNIQRSELGAISNRLNHTVNNLTNISSNLSAAKGGIEDADFALETTNLAKNQILQQASTAMLAQANASKQNVLSLLQG
jgi:flagellin